MNKVYIQKVLSAISKWILIDYYTSPQGNLKMLTGKFSHS